MNHSEAAQYFCFKDITRCGYIKDGEFETEISPSTANALELKSFFTDVLTETRTETGTLMLMHSLISPPRKIEAIKARQEAIRELREKDTLSDKLDFILRGISYVENGAHGLLAGGREDSYIFCARDLIRDAIDKIGSLDEIESPYLREKVQSLRRLNGSDIHKLSEGMIYRQGFRTPLHAGQLNLWCLPWTVPNTLAHFRPLTALTVAGLTGLMAYSLIDPSKSTTDNAFSIITGMFAVPIAGFISGTLAGAWERRISLPPLIRKLKGDEGARTAYSSFGFFDEMLTLSKFAKDMESKGHPMVLPEIVDSPRQRVYCENLVNLVQAIDGTYIPNKVADLGSNGEGLTFITGPNSGGKTSFSKALSMLQILGQMGSYVPATKAVLSPADRIIYQVGVNDSQNDKEGGYGTQLKQTRDILERIGPQSFVVVDDLMSGTEENAMAKQTRIQFYGLYHTGANVLMITHRHDIAKEFREKTGKGNYLQIEFNGDVPTRQLIPGIAPTSRPDLVESRVRMGEEDVEGLLRERGFLDGKGFYDLR